MTTRLLSTLTALLLGTLPCHAQDGNFTLAVPGLKSVVIDSDERESFLGLALDSSGRLFAGCREALFVYEPKKDGLYQPRQLLFRFPKDSWIFDIAIRGDDLYVATHWAIYLLEGAVKKREDIEPKRLVWGLPQMKDWDMHQGIHDITIGPGGDLYFSHGDQIESYGIESSGTWDHWMHWTYYHGSKGTKVSGVGGVFRISPDGEEFDVVAMGTRNSCGVAFDRSWNLFTTDNDHESRPKDFIPGRLLHVTQGAYFSWPRGWMPEKTPWRADLLDTMHPDLGRYVPTGMAYYDDTFLPEACRHNLYVAEWGRGKVERHPLRPDGASFKVDFKDFFGGQPTIRPVGLAVGRGGRIFVSNLYMDRNEASPICRSDIVMITRADDTPHAPFEGYEETTASLEKLYDELGNPSWSQRYRAHVELTRRGADATAETAKRLNKGQPGEAIHSHLLWLAANEHHGLVAKLISSPRSETRLQAARALAKFSPTKHRKLFEKALEDPHAQVVHAAVVALHENFDTTEAIPRIITIAQSSDRLLRQAAIQALAKFLSADRVLKLCEAEAPAVRLVGILVAGERLTIPPLTGPLPKEWPLSPMKSPNVLVGETIEIISGNYTMAEAWAKIIKSPDDLKLFAALERRLDDPIRDNAKQAAFFLKQLKDPRTEARTKVVLGLTAPDENREPLKGATTTGIKELPEHFAIIDWPKAVTMGDPKAGEKLYKERGCAVCHAAKDGDDGSGGPSLIGVGNRFTIPYLVEAVVTPNKTVSPIFKWSMITKKDGTKSAGLVIGENGSELELLLPAAVRQTINKKDISKREIQNRSPMPEGLITTPAELRDLLAYLKSLKEKK